LAVGLDSRRRERSSKRSHRTSILKISCLS